MLKDHKVITPGQLPKTRPIVSSGAGMNCQLSNILSELLEPIAEMSTNSKEVISSEDLLSRVDKINKKLKKRQAMGDNTDTLDNLILLGADAEALYPSLQKNITADIVSEEILKSPLNFQDLDGREMGRYLYLNMTEEEHLQRGIRHLIPSRMTNGRKRKLTMHAEQILGPHKPKEK